jgi:hypothetical protein
MLAVAGRGAVAIPKESSFVVPLSIKLNDPGVNVFALVSMTKRSVD